MNQCLRFPTHKDPQQAAPGPLLAFGISICRACCIAEISDIDPTVNPNPSNVNISITFDYWKLFPTTFQDNICNYPPDFFIESSRSWLSGIHPNDQSELIPRFDMKWADVPDYLYMDVDRPNNLFIHGGITCNISKIIQAKACSHYGKSSTKCNAAHAACVVACLAAIEICPEP